jgi:hypothetical protein
MVNTSPRFERLVRGLFRVAAGRHRIGRRRAAGAIAASMFAAFNGGIVAKKKKKGKKPTCDAACRAGNARVQACFEQWATDCFCPDPTPFCDFVEQFCDSWAWLPGECCPLAFQSNALAASCYDFWLP